MPSSKNTVLIAAAGSRKTTGIVEDALKQPDKRILITTYTIDNMRCIESMIVRLHGCIPENILVMTWFTFLLRDGARPYQNFMNQTPKIDSINFPGQHNRFAKKTELRYFIDSGNRLYKDVVADFVHECNTKSGGKVIARMEQLYDVVYVDEVQDLSGYDLDLLELLMDSKIALHMVGDPRQSTFTTNRSARNKQYRGSEIVKWFKEKEKKNKVSILEKSDCHRCNQVICDFADAIYPDLPKTTSHNTVSTGHDGVFEIPLADLPSYIDTHRPTLLRHSKASKTHGYHALNFGAAKGATFDRVLIFPTAKIKKYLESKDHQHIEDKSRFYVAVTRAKHSVAFVV